MFSRRDMLAASAMGAAAVSLASLHAISGKPDSCCVMQNDPAS